MRRVAAPAVLRRVGARDADAFALLRTRPEGLPAAVRQALRTPIVGENWGLAQRIDADAPGRYWLVPGIGYLCIVSQPQTSPNVGTVCERNADALAHGVAMASLAPGSRLVLGIAPDGVRAIDVHTAGRVVRVSVMGPGGLFVRRDAVPRQPDRLTLVR